MPVPFDISSMSEKDQAFVRANSKALNALHVLHTLSKIDPDQSIATLLSEIPSTFAAVALTTVEDFKIVSENVMAAFQGDEWSEIYTAENILLAQLIGMQVRIMRLETQLIAEASNITHAFQLATDPTYGDNSATLQ